MNTHVVHHKLQLLQRILQGTYGLLFIVAGADKFFNLVTQWDKYLSPFLRDLAPVEHIMMAVGIIEIGIGILVFIKPRLGAYAVIGWFLGIVVNLLLMRTYFDIVVRDLVMAVGALILAQLSDVLEKNQPKNPQISQNKQ